jgi:CRISPR-associated endonuclease/helicase Cas3
MKTFEPIAHVRPDDLRTTHSLEQHLHAVARSAGDMSTEFGAGEWGRLAGLWHDLGKYSEDFQRYIRKSSGYEAHLVDSAPVKVNHSSAGALHAQAVLSTLGLPLAYLIAGHHAGLPDWSPAEGEGNAALDNRLREDKQKGLLQKAIQEAPDELLHQLAPSPSAIQAGRDGKGLHLWIRMLFSCLTDADFLDTEAFMNAGKSQMRGGYPELATLLSQFDAWMKQMEQGAEKTPVNLLRANVLRQCREKATGEPGLYTLTVPTGGGKTLSSLAFALSHAVHHKKRRVVYAIPYTSIIEQTAEVFRGIYKGRDAVLEHHCNLASEKDSPKNRLATENWDAPLIVTTNVQLFESLFAARTSRCRKLHNLVNSVIILDEAQLLPPEYLQPILDVMRLLIEHYGVTFVLCTATQPALGSRQDSFGKTWLRGPGDAKEIVPGTEELYRQLERVEVTLPQDLNSHGDWDEIADRVKQHESVLAIVNTRADCHELHRRMPPGTVHLSALMCGEHRSYVIKKIKEDLPHKPVRVISTQLIEAGVDVDFPVVFRALAGLDSIAQAAGRCNREGKLGRKGQVYVFVPPKQAPAGLLHFGEDACKAILHERPEKPLTPEFFNRYFTRYYKKVDSLDKYGIDRLLTQDAQHCRIQFRTAAEEFQLIDEDGSVSIIVPYANPDDASRDSRPLIARLRAGELDRDLLRQLQRFTVTVRKRDFCTLRKMGDIEEIVPDLWVLKNETAYSGDLGLIIGKTSNPDPGKLCC